MPSSMPTRPVDAGDWWILIPPRAQTPIDCFRIFLVFCHLPGRGQDGQLVMTRELPDLLHPPIVGGISKVNGEGALILGIGATTHWVEEPVRSVEIVPDNRLGFPTFHPECDRPWPEGHCEYPGPAHPRSLVPRARPRAADSPSWPLRLGSDPWRAGMSKRFDATDLQAVLPLRWESCDSNVGHTRITMDSQGNGSS